MIIYDKLWETMKIKHISQYRLIRYYGISAGQISRLKKNMYISTHTVDVLCRILNCSVSEIMEYHPDPPEDPSQTVPPVPVITQASATPNVECKKSVKK